MQARPGSQSSRKNVLVVNRDADTLGLLQGILSQQYRVLLAADATSAFRLLELGDLQVDLVVVDRDCPEADRLIARMQSVRTGLRVVESNTLIEDGVIRIRAAGKPAHRSPLDLLSQIRAALEQPVARTTPTR